MASCFTRWVTIICLLVAVNPSSKATGSCYVNVALGKPTKQSTTRENRVSSRAVDGNRNPVFNKGSCTHTESVNTGQIWWIVDLLAPFPIHSVAITNRAIANSRLKNFRVFVSKVNPLPTIPASDGTYVGQMCVNHSGILAAGGPHTLPCSGIVTGRYVYIHKPHYTNVLTLCEMEVMTRQKPDFVGKKLVQRTGRKSVLSPFYSTMTPESPSSTSVMRCVLECWSRSEGVARIMQVEKSTGRCDCIQKNAWETSGSEFIVNSDWILMDEE